LVNNDCMQGKVYFLSLHFFIIFDEACRGVPVLIVQQKPKR